MNKKLKYFLMFIAFGFLFTTTGCNTSSFCTAKDQNNIKQAYAEKITIVVVDYYEDLNKVEVSDPSFVIDLDFKKSLEDNKVLDTNSLNQLFEEKDFTELFKDVHEGIAAKSAGNNVDVNIEKYVSTYTKMVEEKQFLYQVTNEENGKTSWKNPDTIYSNAQNTLWKTNPQACLTSVEFNDVSGGSIEGKTWGDAWGEGLLEGLFVYPISWLLYTFTNLIGSSGIGQVLAIFITTVFVRLLTIAFQVVIIVIFVIE